MPTDKLTDAVCKRAAARERPYKMADGRGMALWVSTTGAKAWRLYYRVDGRPQTKSLGAYPEVSLAEARRLRDKLRADLRAGVGIARPRADAMTVQQACRQYWAGRLDTTERYRQHVTRALEMHIYPACGARLVAAVTRDDILGALLRVDAAGKSEYARKLRVWISLVFDWCVERGHMAANHCASIRPERAFARRAVEHHPALDLREVPALMQALDLEADLQSVMACRLLAYTWSRTTELRMMRWDELDGDLWRLPAGRMKRRRDHLVPLSRQSVAIIERMRARSAGSVYVFPAPHTGLRPMSENAVLALLYRLGYKGRMSGHGWRSIGSTWAHEAGYAPDVIERQLAHAPEKSSRMAYNRAEYMNQRRGMLQAWADYLDQQAGLAQR